MKKIMWVSASVGCLIFTIWLWTAVALDSNQDIKKEASSLKTAPAEDHSAHHAGHHSTGKGHKDPGPRLIAAADALRERVEAEKIIGPEPTLATFGEIIQTPDGIEALKLLDKWGGGVYYGNMEGYKRSVPYSISAMEATFEYKDEIIGMHSAMDHAEHHHCAQMLVNDRYERKEPPITETLKWVLVLDVKYDATTGMQKVVDVLAPNGWPTEVTSTVQSCYTGAFRGVEWKATQQRSRFFDWPICINPPSTAGRLPWSIVPAQARDADYEERMN